MRVSRLLLLAAALLLVCVTAMAQPQRPVAPAEEEDAPPISWFARFFRVGVVLQVIAVIHFARRRPENYWLWIIFIGGAIGATAYVIAEMLPDLGLVRQSMKGLSRRKRIRALEAMVLENPSAGNYEELGDLLLEEKRYARARECFDAAISSRTDHVDPFYRRGVCAFYVGDYASAMSDLDRTVKAEPKYDYGRALNLYAQSLAKSGRPAEANAAFDRLLTLSSSSETLIAAADFFAEHGRAAEARELAARILARRPTMPRYQQRRDRPWLRRAAALQRKLKADDARVAAVA